MQILISVITYIQSNMYREILYANVKVFNLVLQYMVCGGGEIFWLDIWIAAKGLFLCSNIADKCFEFAFSDIEYLKYL